MCAGLVEDNLHHWKEEKRSENWTLIRGERETSMTNIEANKNVNIIESKKY